MSKNNSDNNKYVMFQTLRRGRNNDGVCLQINPTITGNLMFTLAHQIGIENNLPRFDYQNSIKLSFSDLEAAEIALMIKRQLMSGGFDAELKYPHLAAKNPKNITLKFGQYNNKVQCTFGVYPTDGRGATIFLNEAEMYALQLNLESQVNLYCKKNMIEIIDTRDFKEYMAGGKN